MQFVNTCKGTEMSQDYGVFKLCSKQAAGSCRQVNAALCTCEKARASLFELMRPARQRFLLLFVGIATATAAPDLPIPATGAVRDIWDKVVNSAWLTAKPRIAFCLGEKEAGVLKTMLDSFPDPLPTEPAEDPVCSNATELGKHLCGPKSLMEYYKVNRRFARLLMLLLLATTEPY
jgi:hypothetical protein